MKHETKLKRILATKDKKLRKLKLINYGFKLFPGSNNQKEVLKEIKKLS